MELVSVIIPVYNGEKYLKSCLDSILKSDYEKLQIILVDDGSNDSTLKICDNYAEKDHRVQVIHQANGGLVAARNAGLRVAKGQYISFVDADDMIAPCFYTKMVAAIEEQDADIAACEYSNDPEKVLDYQGKETRKTVLKTFEEQLAVLTNAPSVRKHTWTSCYVWNKLYRAKKITEPFQKECLMCEDLRFNYSYIKTRSKMVILPEGLYFYRIHDESIMGTYRKHKGAVSNGIANARLWGYIAEDANCGDALLAEYLHVRAAYVGHGALWRVYQQKTENEYQDFAQSAHRLIRQYCTPMCRDKETYPIHTRCAVWCCAHVFWAWRAAVRFSRLISG